MGYKLTWIYIWNQKVRPSLPIPTNWLLGYYPFELDGNDYSGNGNNATVTWCTFWTIWGKAWVQLETSYSNYPTNYIISPITYDNVPVTAIYWGYVTSASGWQGHFGNCWATDNADCVRMRSGDSDYFVTAYGASSGTSTMTLNIWTMYAVTIQWTSWTIYINWQQSSTFTTWTNYTGTWPRAWWHQAWWSTQIHPFVWWLRQSALYNRCLSAQEISDYYNATV